MIDQLFEFVANHPILVAAFAILLALFIRNEMRRGGKALTPQEVVNYVNRNDAVVIDVREPKEYEAGHIVDAINIPHGAVEERIGELQKFKDRPVIVVCAMGQHSGAVNAQLVKHGFNEVARLRGGMAEWRNQSLPVVKG